MAGGTGRRCTAGGTRACTLVLCACLVWPIRCALGPCSDLGMLGVGQNGDVLNFRLAA